MSSLLVRRLLGLAAGSLALLAVADASARAAPKKDADAEADAASDADAKGSKKKGADAADAKGSKKKGADDDDADAAKKPDDDAKDADADADKDAKPKKKEGASLSPNSAHEEEGKDYYFIGLRYRHTLLPQFLLNMFVDGGPSVVSIPGIGLEVSKRRDGFELVGALTYQNWGMSAFPFKGKSESDYAWETVQSKLQMINATADFLWSTKINGDEVEFLYGVTAGIAFVWGDLLHAQSHPPNGTSPGKPSSYVACQPSDATSGPWAGNYCNAADNNRWAGYVEPSWANGGYRPMLWPTFGPQLGLRIKPTKQFVARVDLGVNVFSGIFLGIGADYGL